MDQEAAKRVCNILMQFRTEFREVYPAVKQSSTEEDFAHFNGVFVRVFHKLYAQLERIYREHPDLRVDGW